MSIPTLPIELITEILLCLRVKPLLRFTSVSKSWYSLINSPNFIKLHLTKTLTSDHHPNLLISHISLSSAVIDNDGTDDNLRTIRFSELDHPLKHAPAVLILGSCNGLVLISDYSKKSVFLYNPSNKTHRLVPPFYPSPQTNPIFKNSLDPKNFNLVVFGFGYDSVSDDYKALRVIQTRKKGDVVYRETAVYSLKSDSWKCVVDEQWRNFSPIRCGLFNECLHFVVTNDSSPGNAIKCFNLGTEKFSIFNMPENDGGWRSANVGELGGRFFLGLNYHYSPIVKSVIWVMKEYGKESSWSKLYAFSGSNITGCLTDVRPVLYSKDRRRLLIDVDGYSLGWYDIEKNKFKRIKAYGTPPPPDPFETWTIVDSLVSLHRRKDKLNGGTAIKKNLQLQLDATSTMATPTLPTEIITEILLRLRVKPLLRFKSVSKSWYSLINSPNFIKLHLTKTLTSDNHPYLLISHLSLSSAVIDNGGTDKNLRTISFSDLDHPLKHLPPVQILGSCNGIVLISDYRKYTSVYLYNPSNKTHRLLPPFKPSPQTNPVFTKNANAVRFGFGYDSVSDDYKVLRVIETRKNNAVVYRETAVYSLKSDSWKCVEYEQWHNFEPFNGALFNECLHFMVAIDYFPYLAIKCFDLRTEKFSIFNIPAKIDGGKMSAYAGELGGCFFLGLDYLSSSPVNENRMPVQDERMVKTVYWVMKEYGKEESWVKLYTFSPANITGCFVDVRPVVYSKDRRRLLLEVDGMWFGWYDIERNKFKRIKALGIPPPPLTFETWTVVDNLVSLCRHKGKSNGGTAIKKLKEKSKGGTAIKKNEFLSSGFKLRL